MSIERLGSLLNDDLDPSVAASLKERSFRIKRERPMSTGLPKKSESTIALGQDFRRKEHVMEQEMQLVKLKESWEMRMNE